MEGEKKARRKCDRDFILEAVKLDEEQDSVAETARNLGIHESLPGVTFKAATKLEELL